jgi:hypothetical protein
MARLIGGQRLVLQAISELPKDSAGYVGDSQIAQKTRMAIGDVRDWLETLEGDGHVEVARASDGLRALIKAEGRLALGLYQPFKTPASSAMHPGPSPGPSDGSSGPQHDSPLSSPLSASSNAGQSGPGPDRA